MEGDIAGQELAMLEEKRSAFCDRHFQYFSLPEYTH